MSPTNVYETRHARHRPDQSGLAKDVKLFKNRRNQAVRIPMDFAFDADTVRISRDGERLILEPVRENALVALLDSWQPLDDALHEFPAIDDPPVAPEDIL